MDTNEQGDTELDDVQQIDDTDDSVDWKAEHKALAEKVIKARERSKTIKSELKQIRSEFESYKQKHPEVQAPPKQEIPEPKKSDELDYGKLAFYNSQPDVVRITHPDDLEYIKNELKTTGKPQEEVLNFRYVQDELKARAEARVALQAHSITGTRRAGQQGNELEIAYAKYTQTGKLPDDPRLRREVVNKRYEYEKSKNQFTDVPVVEGR